MCDWDDKAAREALVDELGRDGYAALLALDERRLSGPLRQAAELLATVLGQDLEPSDGGLFRIARRVAKDRVISTVDPDARHGHKTAARGFDGYKGHIAVDPDSEIITATEVTAGNVADGSVGARLLTEVLDDAAAREGVEVYGDSSYGTAELVEHIEEAGGEANVKVQAPSAAEGMFGKDAFRVDLQLDTVTCPAGRVVPIAWKAHYRATRPKVERKFGHLMKHRHGGRRARVRGCARVGHDFALLAAAVNLKRLAVLGVGVAPISVR